MIPGSFKLSRSLQQPVPEAPPKDASFPIDLPCKRKSAHIFSPKPWCQKRNRWKKGNQCALKASRLAHAGPIYVPTKGPRMGWAACLCPLPVLGAQGLSSHETPHLEAFKTSWGESKGKRASQEIWRVVMNEESFILNNKFVPLPWKKTPKLNFQNFRKEWNGAIR